MKHPHHLWAILRPGIIPVFFLSAILNINGQSSLPDARSIALGGITTLTGNGSSTSANPALLGYMQEFSCTAGHSMPFLVKEIGISSLETVIPVFPGSFSARSSEYGLKGFKCFATELGYGMKLSEKLSAGVTFNYYNTLSQGEWNYLWNLGIGAGCHFMFSATTRIGIVIQNPFTIGNYPAYGPVCPASISLGLSHQFYDNTTLLAEFAYLSPGVLQFRSGIEYRSASSVLLRSAYHSSPQTFSAGAGIILGKLGIDLAFDWSPVPGISPAVQLIYTPGR